VQEVLQSIMRKLKIKCAQYICLQANDIVLVAVVDPVAELGRVDFLVFHGYEEAGLRDCHSFELIAEGVDAGEVEVHVVDGEVGGGAKQVELKAHAEDVAHQVAAHLHGQQSVMPHVAVIDHVLLLALQHVLPDLLLVLIQLSVAATTANPHCQHFPTRITFPLLLRYLCVLFGAGEVLFGEEQVMAGQVRLVGELYWFASFLEGKLLLRLHSGFYVIGFFLLKLQCGLGILAGLSLGGTRGRAEHGS
jgi:hypothetical protein